MAGQVDLGKVVGDNGQGVPTGGTTGQLLKKKSNSNYDTEWWTPGAAAEKDVANNLNTSSAGGSVLDAKQGAMLANDIGVVEETNTATHNITAGQYVIWKGALYTASTNIATGATLSISNLTAVPGGGLNALNGKLTRITYSKLGSPTNLSGGSSFLCASDGYLYVYCANNGTNCTINYSDGTVSATLLSAAYNGSPDERTVYVRKGMNVTIINTNSTVRFYPFVE